MARINLLPWRAALRKERQRRFIGLIGAAAGIAAGAIVLTHLHLAGEIDFQNQRNQYLSREIAELDRRIKEIESLEATRTRLLARMGVIEELQRSRPHVVHLFDQIARTLPEGVHLTSLQHRGRALTLQGVAQSNARVSTYMRNLDGSDWLGDPRLDVIQTRETDRIRISEFTLRTDQITPGEEDIATTTAAAPAPARTPSRAKR